MAAEIETLKIDVELSDIFGEQRSFTTFKTLDSFIESEHSFWQAELRGISGQPVKQIMQAWRTVVQEISSLKSNYPQWDAPTRQQQLKPMFGRIQQHTQTAVFSVGVSGSDQVNHLIS